MGSIYLLCLTCRLRRLTVWRLIFLGGFILGKWTKVGIPTPCSDKVGGGKMQASSPPVITPNRSQSNPDDMITLPRPIQSVGMDLHDVSGTSTGQTLPRERRAPPGTHFVRQFDGYTHILLLFLSSTHYCPLFHPLLSKIYLLLTTLRPSTGGLKRHRPGVGLRPASDHPQMVTTPGVLDPADPDARSLQLLLQTWCGSAPRRGPSANGYDAWRFESCGPARKILAAAA